MTNTLQTNAFVGGMNLDTDITMIPADQYRYAENVRIVTDTNGTTGVLQNIQSTRVIEGGDFMSDEEIVLASTTVDKYGVILTIDDQNICRLYRIEIDENNIVISRKIVVKGRLGYSKTSQVKMIANYESNNIIKLYLAAPDTIIKSINIMDNRYVQTPQQNPLLDKDGNLKNVNLLDIQISTLLGPPEVLSLGGGQLQTGIVQYTYQLFNARGASTSFAPVSNPIHLTTSDVTGGLQSYEGANKNISSGKSVNFKVKLNEIPEGLFDNIRLTRVRYNDYTEEPIIEVFQEAGINSAINEYQFTDTGGAALTTITAEEFNKIQENTFTASTIEQKDNVLFAANIKESTWKPTLNGEEYDSRSYRFTKGNKLILHGTSVDQNIETIANVNTIKSLYKSVPLDHDCINPFNSSDPDFNDENVAKYQFNTGIIGGSGPNIDYQFITTDIELDKNYASNLSISTPVTSSEVYNIKDLKGNLITSHKAPAGSHFHNYADPYFASKFKSHHRDEVYRFAIVFFNEKNVASPAYWIADIKFPHCWEDCPWYVDNMTLKGKAIGIRFDIKNYPEGAKAYQIVRCKRTKEDRTILSQAIVSATTSYPYHSVRDGNFDIASETTRRPFTFLGNTSQQNGFISKFLELVSVPAKYIPADRVDRTISTLISPEIDINKDQLAKDIKNCRVDLCLQLDPRTDVTSVISRPDRTCVQCYIPSGRSQYVRVGQQISNEYGNQVPQIGSLTTTDNTGWGMLVGNNSAAPLITNLVGKRYLAHYTGFGYGRGRFNIDEVANPPIIEGLNWGNVASMHVSIGNCMYLNSSVSHSQGQDNGSIDNKTAYFGNCLVVKNSNNNLPQLQHINAQQSGAEPMRPQANGSLLQAIQNYNYTQNTTPVVNIKTSNVPYGGNTYGARSNSTYISTHSYHTITDDMYSSIDVFGGDTYLGVLDHKTAMYIPQYDGAKQSPDTYCGITIADYIPFETTINLNLLYGTSTMRVAGGKDYVDPYLSLSIAGASYGGHTQDKNYYAYNDAYSRESDVQLYAVDSAYSISNLQSNNRIRYSGTKTANEITDSWTQFKVGDYLDVDSSHGDITNLKNFNGQLLFMQKDAVGVAAVNDRSLISDNNLSPLVLGTGGVLDRYDYVTTSNGSDKPNDKSIVATPAGLYWYDDSKNEICAYTQGVSKLSKAKSVQSWLNTNDQHAKLTVYDPKFNEVQFGFNDKVLTYNEQLQAFTSFYNFNPDNYLLFPDKLLYIKDQMIQENADFPFNEMKSKLQLVVNKDPLLTKTYDNVFFSGEFDNIQKMMKDIKFTTKTQTGTIFKDNNEVNNPIEQREDTYRFAVGREDESKDAYSYPSRMKGKYMVCDYLIDCSNQRNFRLPNISTTYRYSMV